MSMKCVCVDKRLKWPPFVSSTTKFCCLMVIVIDSRIAFQFSKIIIHKNNHIKWNDL